jgi:hypothetical protein
MAGAPLYTWTVTNLRHKIDYAFLHDLGVIGSGMIRGLDPTSDHALIVAIFVKA